MVLEQFTASLDIVFLSNLVFILLATFSFIGFLSTNKFFSFIDCTSHYLLVLRTTILLAYMFIFYSIISLFSPITDITVIFFYLFGLILFIINLLKKTLIIDIKWQLLIVCFITLYLLESGFNNDFDYHSHHINLYKSFKFFEFKNNITDGRILYNSGFLILNSGTYLTKIEISLKFLQAFIFSIFIMDVRNYLKIRNSNFISSSVLPLFFLVIVFLTLSKFKNIGTDYIAHIIYLSLILFYLFIYNSNKNYFLSKNFPKLIYITLALLIVLKISMVLCSLICVHYFYLMYKNKSFKNIFSLYIVIPIFLVSIWVFKNLYLSDCFIYPIPKLCFADNKSSIIFESNMISLFAKSVKINYWDESLTSLASMNTFPFWFSSWMSDHFFKILEKFIPCLIIFYFIFYRYIEKKTSKKVIQLIEHQNILFFIWFFSLSIWFLEAPALRFGFSYLTVNIFFLNYLFLKIFNYEFVYYGHTNYLMRVFYSLLSLMTVYQFYRVFT